MSSSRLIIGGILILIGVSTLTGMNIFRYILPLFIIFLGLKVITGRKWPVTSSETNETVNTLNEILIFTGTRKTITSNSFAGGKVVSIFGGSELDLTNVKTTSSGIKLELVAIFGGINIRIPKSWEIDSNAVAILGGVDKNYKTAGVKLIRVKLEGAAILGGIQITN